MKKIMIPAIIGACLFLGGCFPKGEIEFARHTVDRSMDLANNTVNQSMGLANGYRKSYEVNDTEELQEYDKDGDKK